MYEVVFYKKDGEEEIFQYWEKDDAFHHFNLFKDDYESGEDLSEYAKIEVLAVWCDCTKKQDKVIESLVIK